MFTCTEISSIFLFFSRTYIAKPASSWMDDYIDWSGLPGCCRYFPTNSSFCPHTGMYFSLQN